MSSIGVENLDRSGPVAVEGVMVIMADALTVQTQTRGAVPEDAVSFAVQRVTSLLRVASEPVLFARVKLTMSADPAVQRPAITEVNADLNGRLIRAQAAGGTMREAVEHACDRLRIRLQRAARNWEAVRGARPVTGPGQWRHQSMPAPRLPYFPRPPGERAVVRHKSYTLARETPDEAAAEAELLDYDFYLFTEKSTGQDAVIYRTANGYRLALAHPLTRRLGPVDPSITVSKMPAPRLPVTEAATRLEATGQAFLFFINDQTDRGNLIYHRYDGNYGLIARANLPDRSPEFTATGAVTHAVLNHAHGPWRQSPHSDHRGTQVVTRTRGCGAR
jgi:ribosome-associated translation inhibitor RaiA